MATVEIVELGEPFWRKALTWWLQCYLSDPALDTLARAIRQRDLSLMRGQEWDSWASDEMVDAACLLGYPEWRVRRLETGEAVEEAILRTTGQIDANVGHLATYELVEWYDSQPEAEVMGVLGVEIAAEIERRANLAAH